MVLLWSDAYKFSGMVEPMPPQPASRHFPLPSTIARRHLFYITFLSN